MPSTTSLSAYNMVTLYAPYLVLTFFELSQFVLPTPYLLPISSKPSSNMHQPLYQPAPILLKTSPKPSRNLLSYSLNLVQTISNRRLNTFLSGLWIKSCTNLFRHFSSMFNCTFFIKIWARRISYSNSILIQSNFH